MELNEHGFPMYPEAEGGKSYAFALSDEQYNSASFADWRLEMARRGWMVEWCPVPVAFDAIPVSHVKLRPMKDE